MEYGLLFRKTSTCYSNPDIEYLDETSDYKLKILAKKQGIPVEELQERNRQISESISYLTKENHGRVYAGGFLRDALLSKKAMAPEKWDNEIRKKAITSAIYKNIRQFGAYRGGVGHKLIFSMSEELEKEITQSDLNPDELLGKEVKNIMYQFQRKFHPGNKIGFAWGIHHDTDHRHIHIYLCNRTSSGKHVAMSSPLKDRKRKYTQKDQIGYIKGQVIKAQERILNKVKKVNSSEEVRSISEAVTPQVVPRMPENFSDEEEKLEKMRQELVRQENALKLHQEMIRKQFTDNNLHKSLVASGYSKVKKVNKEIAQKYQNLRKSENVVTFKVLKSLKLFPDSGPLKIFANALFALHNLQEKSKRQVLFDQIQASQEYKIRLLNQLKFMDEQRTQFNKAVKRMKQERAAMQKEIYRCRSIYDRTLLRHNQSVFMKFVRDRRLRNEYSTTTKMLWQKRRSRQDSSAELRILRALDEKARTIRASFSLSNYMIPKDNQNKVGHKRGI